MARDRFWGVFCFFVMLSWLPLIAGVSRGELSVNTPAVESTAATPSTLGWADFMPPPASCAWTYEQWWLPTTWILCDPGHMATDTAEPLAPGPWSLEVLTLTLINGLLLGIFVGAVRRWGVRAWRQKRKAEIVYPMLVIAAMAALAFALISIPSWLGPPDISSRAKESTLGIPNPGAVVLCMIVSGFLAFTQMPSRLSISGPNKALIGIALVAATFWQLAMTSGLVDFGVPAIVYYILAFLSMAALGGVARLRSVPTAVFFMLCFIEGLRTHYGAEPTWTRLLFSAPSITLFDVLWLIFVILTAKFVGLIFGQNFKIIQRISRVDERPLGRLHGRAWKLSYPMFFLFAISWVMNWAVGNGISALGVRAVESGVNGVTEIGSHENGCKEYTALVLSGDQKVSIEAAMTAAVDHTDEQLRKCGEIRIKEEAAAASAAGKSASDFIRTTGSQLLPPGKAPNADLGCRWYDIGCRLEEWVLRRLRDAYLDASDRIAREADAKAEEFAKSSTANVGDAEAALLSILQNEITGVAAISKESIVYSALKQRQLSIAGWLYAFLVLAQAYLFVLARLVFRTEQPYSAALAGNVLARDRKDGFQFLRGPGDEGLAEIGSPSTWVSHEQEFVLDKEDLVLGWSLRSDAIVDGEHDRMTIPQKTFAIFPRLLKNRYRMRRVDRESWDRAERLGYDSVRVRCTSPVTLCAFQIPQGGSIYFRDIGPLLGFTDSIKLETEYSLRITSLLFGQAIFRRATAVNGPGRVLFMVTGDPPPIDATGVFPTGTLVAWDVNEHFKVSAQETVADAFLSEHSLQAMSQRVLRDQNAGRGFSTAVIRVVRRFLLPL